MKRVLVGGVGNVFLGDDGFGVEVVARLKELALPAGVEVDDFGVAGVHLAYQMAEGYDCVVLIDAAPRGGRPGDLYVIEPERSGPGPEQEREVALDAHGMHPEAVLRLVQVLGGGPDLVMVVGCEPASLEEGMGLSQPVQACVEPAVTAVRDILEALCGADGDDEQRRQQCCGR